MKHRVALVAATAAGLLTTGAVVAVSTASAASTGCSATSTVVRQWPGGFQGGVSFPNLGDPLSTWKLEFTFPDASQKVTQGWNATWSQSGPAVTAATMSWNNNVATNGSVSLGFIGAYGSSNPKPTSFTVNGVTCTGSSTTTPQQPPPAATPPTTTPPPTPPTPPPTPPPTTPPTSPPTSPPPGGAAPALHVSGNKLVT